MLSQDQGSGSWDAGTGYAQDAAGSCVAYNEDNAVNWYLPSICEMGDASGFMGCENGNLTIYDNGNTGSTNDYWVSFEVDANNAAFVSFPNGQASGDLKDTLLDTRCSRAFTANN